MAVVQPMGQAHHIPAADWVSPESKKARSTRSIRSVKVAAINCPIAPAPLRMPSATNFADTAK